MASAKSCPNKDCNSTEFEIGGVGESEHTICIECGTVVEESTQFQSPEAGTFVTDSRPAGCNLPDNYQRITGSFKSVNEGKKVGRQVIEIMCQKLSMSKPLMNDAKALYERAIAKENFAYRIWLDSKEVLAIVCVYIIARQNYIQIALTHLCRMGGIERAAFSPIFYKLKAELQIEIPGIDIEDFYNSLPLSQKVSEKVCGDVMRLFQLCQKCWLTTGRDHERILLYLTYIAWVGEDYGKRKMVGWPKFARQFNEKNMKANVHQKHILSYLVDMAKNIPWVDIDDFKHDKEVLAHLGSILKFHVSLANEVVAEIAKVKDKQETNCSEDDTQSAEFTGVDEIKDEEGTYRDIVYKHKHGSKNWHHTNFENYEFFYNATENSNSEKIKREQRDWTLPKVEERPFPSPEEIENVDIKHPDLDSEELTEHDIPEKDMDQYVRSEPEVKRLKIVHEYINK